MSLRSDIQNLTAKIQVADAKLDKLISLMSNEKPAEKKAPADEKPTLVEKVKEIIKPKKKSKK